MLLNIAAVSLSHQEEEERRRKVEEDVAGRKEDREPKRCVMR